MLSREIYGTLTPKQREYADIVRHSSQMLLEIAHEVLDLSSLDARLQPLQPTSVDVEMIGQHVQRMLVPIAQKNNQEIHISVEPGSRLWTLDREVVRQMLYHLVYSIITLSGEGGTIRIHGSERENCLNLSLWLAHPWLGEGLPNTIVSLFQRLSNPAEEQKMVSLLLAKATGRTDLMAPEGADEGASDLAEFRTLQSRETLSLLLSRYLTERHGGTLTLQGHADASYRFLVVLPFLKTAPAE
jgi:signal transduction histidine kinase